MVVHGAMVHRGEESVISGSRGSGTIFFNGCNLNCIFCQNYDISQSDNGTNRTAPQLVEMFIRLANEGVHNINLVTPSHFVPSIAQAVALIKNKGIQIPFIYNSGGYDAPASLKTLDGLIDIYMPDLKYADDAHGQRYSGVPDYFTVAQDALREMYRQVGDPVIKQGVMQKGLLIRHLVMPGLIDDSIKVLDWIRANVPTAMVNLMDQYRPVYQAEKFKEINRSLTIAEFRTVSAHFSKLGLRDDGDYTNGT
jgi:putative pyruvate formate lyase activating enzyme